MAGNPQVKTRKGAGARRVMFMGNPQTNLWNKYVPGANVGGLNASVRRALKRRATASAGTMTNPNSGTKPCCPELQFNSSNLAFPWR